MDPDNEESALEAILTAILGFAALFIFVKAIEYVVDNAAIFIFLGVCISGFFAYYFIQKTNREFEESSEKIREEAAIREEQWEEDRAIDKIKRPLNALETETKKNSKKIRFLEQNILENNRLINDLEHAASDLKIGVENYLERANIIIEMIDKKLSQ